MANKPMGFLNIGSNNYEIVDVAGRQATQELSLTVSQLSASNLPYSSSKSTKEAIDELANNKIDKEWTLAGETIGSTEQAFPASWNEMFVQIRYGSTNINTLHIYKEQTRGMADVSLGQFGTSYIIGQLSQSKGKVTVANWGGSDVLSVTHAFWYYR